MISLFFFGFVFSFLGYTLPSVLNMTALKISLETNKREFTKFTLGVSLVVFVQVFVSIYILEYILENPTFIEILEKTGIVVLIFLSIYFYKQNQKEKKQVEVKQKNSFFTGIILSLLNMFAIPFFCGSAALLITFNGFSFNLASTFFFMFGSVVGTYFILYLYGRFAKLIQQKTGSLTNNINLLLSFITGGFALVTFLKFVV
ncbi:LysE family transporter [Polaribacter sp. Z014]|uniref:LysE family transporter n=1 Tax=unclassified Polaribacter TaxID=196858 RepID=UPI00193C5350|nr:MULTISPECIES: LysE family transporter [unclassified Polaribacter]MCL7761983.1 LysE family transporter [Polaribacter sp. Z014]QVY64588.1 LysE family transporter [Polaribacter sp. Q13]